MNCLLIMNNSTAAEGEVFEINDINFLYEKSKLVIHDYNQNNLWQYLRVKKHVNYFAAFKR